ncbi:MAG: hypothetical protein VZQ47_06315 [Treponema sp.]|nr:hypothetical protein [Treponema sp.]
MAKSFSRGNLLCRDLGWGEVKGKAMRKIFSQVLKDGKVDIEKEYRRLYNLFYETNLGNTHYPCSICDIIDKYFSTLRFRGTCLSLEDFNDTYDFHFEEFPQIFDIDYLVNFCEYTVYFVLGVAGYIRSDFMQLYLTQIEKVIEKIGYMRADNENGEIIYVEKSQSAVSVSELLPKPTSYKVIFYNHHSLKGNLDEKKSILNQLYLLLEPKRKYLHIINPKLENMIFYCFNNLNIRHRNTSFGDKQYKAYVARMTSDLLEKWYDETYQMCLLAFLELEHENRCTDFEALKRYIETAS